MTKQIRFWHFAGEDVLIKINAGQTLRHFSNGATDEGWWSETNEWSFDGETLRNEWMSDSRDCDGRLTRHGVSVCPIADLRAGYCNEATGIKYPKWKNKERGQRDYSAEAMGY
jgi:hypothetical protein